ncbi:MAG: hypothetical protein SGJ24_13555 [Chloroflexota bacterium]|nr:hypothetical protein [Chloroflexota bacterium]
MPTRRDDWIDEDEYPDDADVEQFGESSPPDNDPLTIGTVGSIRPPFWTRGRIALLVIGLIIVAALVLPALAPLL